MHLGIKNFVGVNKHLFGTGVYSSNITGTGITVSGNNVNITGAATVAPDATTGAAVVTCDWLALNGASASLSPSTNCKGLIIFARTKIQLLNGAKLHMNGKGKAGNFGNLTVLDLVPASLASKLRSSLASYIVLGEGAAGGASITTGMANGNTGAAATAMKTGGGGAGARYSNNTGTNGAGGKGGPCCGGAGGGGKSDGPYSAGDGGAYGGPGGAGESTNATYPGGGGAGDPIGAIEGTGGTNTVAQGPGGGLLLLFAPAIQVNAGCIISADGSQGASCSVGAGGGGAGGGCVCVFTNSGGLANSGTIRANGGLGGVGYYSGGPGGAGSTNTFTI